MEWTRSDKIAACSLVLAVVALLYPIVGDIRSATTKPTAAITSPTNTRPNGEIDFGLNRQNLLYSEHVEVIGNASNIPRDQDLWLIARPHARGTWLPVSRLQIASDGNWRVAEAQVALSTLG